jgi:hypothetical protein
MNSFTMPAFATNRTKVFPNIVPFAKQIRAVDPRNSADFANTFLSQFSSTDSFLSEFKS